MANSWKTTLAGLGIGGGYFFLTALQSGVTTKDALISAGLVALGALAKDSDVSHAPSPLPESQKVEK